jgi:type IV pilus assembly protein PilC
MMEKVADFYEEEVDNAVNSLTSIMEPLIIVVLGVTVGTIVIAIYTPILSMYDAVDNY